MRIPRKYIIMITVLIALIVVTGILVSGCRPGSSNANGRTNAASEDSQLYTCGMHPSVIQEGPGQCPICGMNLTPMDTGTGTSTPDGERRILFWVAPMDPTYVRDEPGVSPMGMDLVPVYEDEITGGAAVSVDPAIIQSIGVRYAEVEVGPVEKTIRAAAHVDFDEDHYTVLSTRTGGWIETLHVTSPGDVVHEGDPLFDFYAPTIYSAQEEFLIARRMGDSTLANAALERLRLLGVSDEVIDDIRANGSRRALTITAPMDGVVVSIGSAGGGGGMSSSSGGMDMGGVGGMGDSGAGMSASTGGTIREGDYVGSGTAVFSIADLSSVWVYAHVYEDELEFVREGLQAELELEYLPGRTFEGVIDYVYPFLDRQTRDIKMKLRFPNPDGDLMPGMFGTVRIESRIEDNGLLIPSEAVIYSGDSRIVFLALGEGHFAPVEVRIGVSTRNAKVQVLDGLVAGQTVVTSAQFLLDSESRLREALNRMLAGTTSPEPSTSDETAPQASDEWADLAPDDPDALFRCPMSDDRYYTSEDGECPICGMFLEPHDPENWNTDHDHAHQVTEHD